MGSLTILLLQKRTLMIKVQRNTSKDKACVCQKWDPNKMYLTPKPMFLISA